MSVSLGGRLFWDFKDRVLGRLLVRFRFLGFFFRRLCFVFRFCSLSICIGFSFFGSLLWELYRRFT